MSLVIVGVGNKVSETGSSETGVLTAMSVGVATGSSDALDISPITSVGLLLASKDLVETCREASVAIFDE